MEKGLVVSQGTQNEWWAWPTLPQHQLPGLTG